MAVYRLPSPDWAMQIVDIRTGRMTPGFQRFWQNLKFTSLDGANQNGDIAALQSQVTTINGQISTINSTLTGKAPLASPAFTGTPAAPTATAGTSTTQIATTAFVGTAVSDLEAAVNLTLAGKVDKATFDGFDAATGTATRTTFDTATVTLEELAERVKALIDDLKA